MESNPFIKAMADICDLADTMVKEEWMQDVLPYIRKEEAEVLFKQIMSLNGAAHIHDRIVYRILKGRAVNH